MLVAIVVDVVVSFVEIVVVLIVCLRGCRFCPREEMDVVGCGCVLLCVVMVVMMVKFVVGCVV